eukprot:TRINITY_DN26317_c0_g1_i1.p1 TRINITY_DN26317_c0_g1~~TRINITY_DN26317_c0_g1_i1.p1  ORF type:complete len:312 (-),score=75.04 TRINITY_DN26317_c0_g1_i1:24-959(-)
MGISSSKTDASDKEAVSKALCNEALRNAHLKEGVHMKILDVFEEWDCDGNGWIDSNELKHVFKKLGIKGSPEQFDALFVDIDTNCDGKIQYEEFCAWLCQAPYMEEYFKMLLKIQKEAMNLRRDMFQMQKSGTEQERTQTERMTVAVQRKQWQELAPLVAKSFDHHDKDGGGTLSKDESIIFFSNYCKLLTNYSKLRLDSLKAYAGTSEAMQELLDHVEQDLTYYHQNPSTCHLEAFSCLDVDEDGKLRKEFVVETLTPGNNKYELFHRKLKLGGWLHLFEAELLNSSGAGGTGSRAFGTFDPEIHVDITA